MNRLFDLLSGTTNLVVIKIEEPGLDAQICSNIIKTEKFVDGLMLYFDNENHFFISSILNTIIESDEEDDDIKIYYLKNSMGTIITLTVYVNEEEL